MISEASGAQAPAWALPAIVALAGAMAVAFFPLPADDAYIVARYAEQVHAGRGLVYNEGEAVNALTSPLHFGVLVVLRFLAVDVVTLYRVLCALVVGAALVATLRAHFGRDWRGACFLALTLACPFVAFWSVGGLETPLLLCVCTAIACLALEGSARSAAWIVALAAVAVLIRYDAVLFAAPIALHAAWRNRHDARVRIALAGGVLAVLAWMVFTLTYYGDLLPTSFYVKAGRAPMPSELARGLLYVASFAVLTWVWIAALLPRIARIAPIRAVQVGLALTAAYALFASTRHMMYGYRLLVPFLPALVLVLLHRREAPARARQAILAAILAAQAGLAAFMYFMSQNPSLSLLAEGRSDADAAFEFSHLGARHTAAFLATAHGQAEAIRRHWAATQRGAARPPRLVVSTGGHLPSLLPDAYVFEQLASYRHECRPALEPLADYAQVIYAAHDAADIARQREAQGREVVARFELVAQGLRAQPLPLVVELWYRPVDAPNPLPPTLRGACR